MRRTWLLTRTEFSSRLDQMLRDMKRRADRWFWSSFQCWGSRGLLVSELDDESPDCPKCKKRVLVGGRRKGR
jgi:hypothetical protein